MRNIVNISLPESMVKNVEQEVKKGGFSTKSEFFRHLVREYTLAQELKKSREEFVRGEGKKLRSLKDLR